jgi:hypothetical protein
MVEATWWIALKKARHRRASTQEISFVLPSIYPCQQLNLAKFKMTHYPSPCLLALPDLVC